MCRAILSCPFSSATTKRTHFGGLNERICLLDLEDIACSLLFLCFLFYATLALCESEASLLFPFPISRKWEMQDCKSRREDKWTRHDNFEFLSKSFKILVVVWVARRKVLFSETCKIMNCRLWFCDSENLKLRNMPFHKSQIVLDPTHTFRGFYIPNFYY